ncbi:hypothetical protein Y032_0761g2125 [Ancylostoma ceylanicum]|nr:hypothetical protein Y032_0761g2125 [Ancylostoma ceylanicum]
MTAVMVPTRSGQPHQLRAVPRGFTPQGTRIMNVVMAPSNVPTSSSSQSLPMQATGQPGGATIMTSGAPTVRHPSPFSEATGVTVKRQLLSQTRPLGPASRDGSPQTVAQVVIAPPPQQQPAPEEQHQAAPATLPQAPAQSEEVPSQRQPSPSHTS